MSALPTPGRIIRNDHKRNQKRRYYTMPKAAYQTAYAEKLVQRRQGFLWLCRWHELTLEVQAGIRPAWELEIAMTLSVEMFFATYGQPKDVAIV